MWNNAPLLSAISSASIFIALIATLVAALAGTAGSIASNRANALEQAKRDTERDAAHRAIAEANARAEEAKEEAARLQERLRKSQEMRRLTKYQAESLEPVLKSDHFQVVPKAILRVSSVEDAEARSYAMEIQKFFQSCGVSVYPTDGGFPSTCVQSAPHETGIAFSVQDSAAKATTQGFVVLQNALHAVGIDARLEVDPTLHEREAVIYILRKPAA